MSKARRDALKKLTWVQELNNKKYVFAHFIYTLMLNLKFNIDAEPMLGGKHSIMASAKRRSTTLVGFDVIDAATAPLVYTSRDGGRTKGQKKDLPISMMPYVGWTQNWMFRANLGHRHSPSTFSSLAVSTLNHFPLSHMAKRARSRPKLRIAISFLLLLLFALSAWPMFPCRHCPVSAVSPRGLTQHQTKCQAFMKHEAEVNQRRKSAVASKKVRQAKLKGRMERLGSAALGVSFFLFLIIDKCCG